ncbi:hypothetical protein L1987_86829 [Smallanthus sonchifolius]|uniref:Uncharacterized protein n=1 Tax=Smallanthus sonchifolius TaxID=185202 RepID=A0ACB8Y0J6_9ASTR|nr:hypothetical protein L1987_86829 [Smallanthus sonchifolius]
MEMKESYGMMDLHHAMVILGGGSNYGGGGITFGSDSTMGMGSGLSGDSCGGGGGNGLDMEVGGRWPKEETLALLDIRARLNSKFKEANHKGHLWDEVSRIMCSEHGYKRSGKKCSEKFENLYKYYKKIKEGKAGRQDKKHYRFFHQLEAILGDQTSTNYTKGNIANPIPLTNATSPPFLEDDNHREKAINKRMLGKSCWKTKITDFIETRMNVIMEKQDKWMEKVMNTIEEKEKDRISKEKQWRKEEVARIESERKFRSNERARLEYRHAALMEAFLKLTKNESTIEGSCTEYYNDQDQIVTGWGEHETTQLIQLRSSVETRFKKGGLVMEDVLWEEIAITMASLGYNRSAMIFKAKWDHINFQLRNKKQKGCSSLYYDHHFQQAGERFVTFSDQEVDGGNMVFMSDPHEMMWNHYGKIKEI